MGSFLRLLLLAGVVVLLYMVIMRPRELRQLGRRARLVGLLYVVALVATALTRALFGWGA